MSGEDSVETKSLCLYEDAGTIELTCRLKKWESSTWLLEDVVNSYLQDDKEDEDVVQIGVRHDEHWLHCRLNPIPPQTILGIWEDYVRDPETENNVNPRCVLTIYETPENLETISRSMNGSTPARPECSCVAPHSEWNRTELTLAPYQPPTANDYSSPVQVDWYDIRQWQRQQNDNSSFLQSPASVCHFLRSILGSKHCCSPWVASRQQDEPHVVGLVTLPNPPEALTEFRVGNASPSYYLHSITHLYLPKNVVWIASLPPSASFSFGDLTEATLLVYRRLGPRDLLSVKHPLGEPENETTVPDGCLWETYVQRKEENGDDNNKEEPVLQYRLLSPPYVSHKQDYPNLLEPLLTPENFETIRNEALSIPQWTAWPEKQHYSSPSEDGTASWTVFPICHCFPANVLENRQWIESTCAVVPQTTALLKDHLGDTLRTALFSRLDPQTTLEPHTGWEDLANHVFRVHLPLVVPPGGLCGTWVDGCVETHEESRLLCFDDSKVHRAFNYSTQERVVLILDLARPSYLPPGAATGGHTEELDKFIKQLT